MAAHGRGLLSSLELVAFMLLGHLAVPIILRHYADEMDLTLLVAGSVAPDVVDKSLQQVGTAVSGRSLAHSLFALGTSSLLVWRCWGNTAVVSWFAGYLGHLICDMGGSVPWLYPFAAYPFERTERRLWIKLRDARPGPAELVLVAWAAVIVLRTWRGGRVQRVEPLLRNGSQRFDIPAWKKEDL